MEDEEEDVELEPEEVARRFVMGQDAADADDADDASAALALPFGVPRRRKPWPGTLQRPRQIHMRSTTATLSLSKSAAQTSWC